MEGKGKEIMTSENERKEKSWDNLPDDMKYEIFQWFSLSPELVLSMCRISKEWNKDFWSTSLANPCILFMSPDSRNDTTHLWFHTVVQHNLIRQCNNKRDEIPRLTCPLQYMSQQTFRGWICCYNKTGRSAMVNPTRGVCTMLPKVLGLESVEETHFYLGYDLERHVWKVLCRSSKGYLRILNLRDENMHWNTLCEASRRCDWNPHGKVDTSAHPTDHNAICLQGKMYFPDEKCFIFFFDLQTEENEFIRGPIGIHRYDRLVKVNDRVAIILSSPHIGLIRIWTLDTAARTWSKLYVIPPPPPHSPKSRYTCVGTIGTNKFVFIPSTPLTEPLHVIYYGPETSDSPLKIIIDCPNNPSPRHVEAILGFLETPNFRSTQYKLRN